MRSRLICLFPEEQTARKPAEKTPSRLKKILPVCTDSFSSALILSIFLHLLLVSLSLAGAFLLSGPEASKFPAGQIDSPAGNLHLFERALSELLQDERNQEKLAGFLESLKGTERPELPANLVFLDQNLSEKEKVELFKLLIKQTVLQPERQTVEISGASESSQTEDSLENDLRLTDKKIFLEKSPLEDGRFEVYGLNRQVEQAFEQMKKAGELKEKPAEIKKETLLLPVGEKGVEVPTDYYYRSCPYEKIMARGAKLFSLVKGFPEGITLGGETEAAARKSPAGAENKITNPAASGTFLVIYYGELDLEKKPSEEGLIPGSQKFPVPRKDWPELLDTLMSYPEDEQFRRLEEEYLQTCDPNDQNLAEFFREFINLNLNGAFFIDEPFIAAFDSLEELFYKKRVFERLLFHIRKAPDSLLAAEFLFCLASSLNFEKRVIAHLNRAYPQARELLQKDQGLVYAFNARAKALTIKTVYEDLRRHLAAMGFSSIDQVLDRYDQEELKIYQYLAGKDGLIRDRALLAMGLYFWNKGNRDEAARLWLKISPAYKTPPLPLIRGKLYDRWSMSLWERIDEILARESLRITHLLNQRAVKFHKWSRRTAG